MCNINYFLLSFPWIKTPWIKTSSCLKLLLKLKNKQVKPKKPPKPPTQTSLHWEVCYGNAWHTSDVPLRAGQREQCRGALSCTAPWDILEQNHQRTETQDPSSFSAFSSDMQKWDKYKLTLPVWSTRDLCADPHQALSLMTVPEPWPSRLVTPLPGELCQFKHFPRQECAATVSSALNSHPHREMERLTLHTGSTMPAVVMAYVCLQVRHNAVQSDFSPERETNLKELL